MFNVAAQMVRIRPALSARLKIIDSQKRIIDHRTGSVYRAISAEAYSKHGFNASAVIYDELHAAPTRELWDVLATSQGTRHEPLMIAITTAGFDRHSICWEVWEYARNVRDGLIRDPYFLPVIYELKESEPWDDPTTWKRVNPNLGISISEEYLRETFERAKVLPSYENTFRNLHLNEWDQVGRTKFAAGTHPIR